MPDIDGTNNNDNIDVTNDNGTLNGNPQGSPIDSIRARRGDDTISVTDSTITGDVLGNAGSDDISVDGSTVTGAVHGGRDNDTISIAGSSVGNVRLGNGDDSLDFISTTVSGDIRGGQGTDSLNLPDGTIVNDATFGTFTVTAGSSYSLSDGSFTLPSGITVNYRTFENGTGFPCFVRGTRIETPKGPVKIEDLKVGDMVITAKNGPQKLRWIGQRAFDARALRANPKLCPIRITAGAMGNGLPERDLLVSRQHRMLVRSRIARRMFGIPEVLIPAVKLTALPGIGHEGVLAEGVEYYHLLFDQHEVIIAEGAPTESLFTGPEAMKSITREAREEILTIFPELADQDFIPEAARYIPPGQKQARLVTRHLQNRKPLLSDT